MSPKKFQNKQKQKPAHPTQGFGVPITAAPHHFIVTIPRGSKQPVQIIEDLGMQALGGEHEILDRVSIARPAWTDISDPVKKVFNQRLKEQNLATSRWKVGDNPVDRLFGKELCVLAWAIESLESSQRGTALRNWLALKPEERWWLFRMTATTAGMPQDYNRGWRVALRYALGDTPNSKMPKSRRTKKQKNKDQQLFLPIKEDTEDNYFVGNDE